jgi:hypothetical protein
MNASQLWTVIGRGISPKGDEVSLVVNDVPGKTQQEAAQNAIKHWAARGAKGYQPHKARVTA